LEAIKGPPQAGSPCRPLAAPCKFEHRNPFLLGREQAARSTYVRVFDFWVKGLAASGLQGLPACGGPLIASKRTRIPGQAAQSPPHILMCAEYGTTEQSPLDGRARLLYPRDRRQ